MTEEQKKISRRNHHMAWCYFKEEGLLPEDAKPYEWVLHHIDTTMKYTNIERYIQWRIEDIVPMTVGEHTKLHWQLDHDERCKKMSETHKERGTRPPSRKGVKLTEEHKRKISETHKGFVYSEESRKRMSEAHKGIKFTEEHRANISKSMIGNQHSKGKPRDEEAKARMSEAAKRRWAEGRGVVFTEEHKQHLSESQRKRRERERAEKEAV